MGWSGEYGTYRVVDDRFRNTHECECGHCWETVDCREVSRWPCPSGGVFSGHNTRQVGSEKILE